MMHENIVIHANTEWRRAPIRITVAQRVCEHPGCTTILSKYNPRHKCSIHERKLCPQQ